MITNPCDPSPAPSRTAAVGRLSLFYGAFFAVIGIQLPFWPVWLASRGLDATDIGMVLAASVMVKVVSNPLIAHLADRRGERRRVMIALGAAALAAFALFAIAGGFWWILLISLLFMVFWSAIMPLGESLTMLTARERDLDYGRLRLWGSLTFIAAAVVSGRVLVGRPEDLVFWLMAGAVAVTLLACFLVPGTRPPPTTSARLPMGQVLRQPGFVTFLAAAALIQGSHSVYYGFGTLHWRAAGHSEEVIGWLWAEGVIAEVVLFAFGAALVRRLGPVTLIALGGIGGAVRWTVTALSTDLSVLVWVQALHALTFGATHLGAIYFIARSVPLALSATAQSLYSATVAGLVAGVAMAVSGRMYTAFGGHAYLLMAVFATLGAAVALVMLRRRAAVNDGF
jgi:PPP family 3-phenylpropionic acid transporter